MSYETQFNQQQHQEDFDIGYKNINDGFANTPDEYFYDRDEFLISEATPKTTGANLSGVDRTYDQDNGYVEDVNNDENFFLDFNTKSERKISHHFSLSTDDLNRDYPIRRAACTSCALCEANGIISRNKDGGFPLRKVASCSICTWDIEEQFSFSSASEGEEEDEEEDQDNDDDDDEGVEEIKEEEEIEGGAIEYVDNYAENEPPPSPIRKRRNSYTRAMEDSDLDLLTNFENQSAAKLNTSTVDIIVSRSPPDGGEEEVYITEETENTENKKSKKSIEKKNKKNNKLKKSNKAPKLEVNKQQTSFERKVSQEFDEIFGKVRQSPNTSFDDGSDEFDLNFSRGSLNSDNKHSSPFNKSKRGSFRKIIRTPTFLRRNKKSKLDTSRSKSVEQLYTNSNLRLDPMEEIGMKKAISSLEMSSFLREEIDEDLCIDEHINEKWINYLNNLGGTAIFGGNENLRYIWHQLSCYQNDLLQPFDDFLKSILDDMQRAFKKCQDLESALSLKTQQQEKETSKIYDDAELAMKQEREQLQEKHSEKEENIRLEHAKQLTLKEHEIQELTKLNTEISEKEQVLTQNNHSLRQTIDSLENQATIILQNEASLKEKNNKLLNDNKTLLSTLNSRDETIRELQEQLIQITNEASKNKENYDSCLRKFKDVAEEKEYLELNISNLTTEIEDLKNQNRSMLDKQHSWSANSSMDLERDRTASPVSPTVTKISQNSFDENSNSMRYNKASDSVKYHKMYRSNERLNDSKLPSNPVKSSSPIIPKDFDNQTLYIQTPNGFTPIRRTDPIGEINDIITPLHKIPNNRTYLNTSNVSHKKSLNFATTGQTPIRLASSRPSEFKVVFTGEANVGKTSLIRRICHGRFRPKREVTQEADFSTKVVECGADKQSVTLKLWDTVGQERFNSIPPSYFRKSDVVILVYDLEDEASFLNAKKWLRMIHDYTDENIFLFLVGNKSDLHHKRSVQPSKGEKLAAENDAMFLETSAKSGENLEKLCNMIATTLLEREETVFIRNDFEGSLCSLSYSFNRSKDISICCQ